MLVSLRYLWLPLATCASLAAAETMEVRVAPSKTPLKNTPIQVAVQIPVAAKEITTIRLKDDAGREIIGQLTAPGVLSNAKDGEGKIARELHCIVPEIGASGVSLSGELKQHQAAGPAFHWEDAPGKQAELRLGERPVLRYMYERVDNSSKARRDETYKIYHHVFDPQGERLVTKGPGGLFPHHRGVFYGFNRITHGGDKKADVWHCNRGESQTHEGFLGQEEGPVLGRHRLAIAWRGQDGEPFAHEERELTVYNRPGGVLIEFASRLTSTGGRVILDGDPQHAGFQFRASQEVPDKTAKLTYYLRPDGKDKPGSFRNWPQNMAHANLPWNALSFVLGEQRYTCVYLDHPQNPKESRFSERDYGRFGSYFEAEIEAERALEVNYRLWLCEGELTVEETNDLSSQFVAASAQSATIGQ
jgi:hypothetical protein